MITEDNLLELGWDVRNKISPSAGKIGVVNGEKEYINLVCFEDSKVVIFTNQDESGYKRGILLFEGVIKTKEELEQIIKKLNII